MKNITLLIPVAAIALYTSDLHADPIDLGSFTTKDGKAYSEATATEILPDSVKVLHSSGIARIPFEDLPQDVIDKVGSFDPERAAQFRQAEKERMEKAQQAEAKKQKAAEIDELTWEPYSSTIRRESANVRNPELFNRLKSELHTIKSVCTPLINSGKVDRATVSKWVKALSERKISEGMPVKLVELAWGKPLSQRENSRGSLDWFYARSYVSFKDGFVDYISVEK